MKTIILIDQETEGHHTTYLRIYTRVVLELGYKVLVMASDTALIKEWIELRGIENSDRLIVETYKEPSCSREEETLFSATRSRFKKWDFAANAVSTACKKYSIKPDLIFFLWIDAYLTRFVPPSLLDHVFPYKWIGLYFHPAHLRVQLKFRYIRKWVLDNDILLQAKNCMGAMVLDEGIITKLKNKIPDKLCVNLPDVTDDVKPYPTCQMTRDIVERANNRVIVSIIGGLEKRKGILTLLRASKLCREDQLYFVFAGQLYRNQFEPEELEELDYIQQKKNSYFCHYKRIPGESIMNSLFAGSDIIFAAYDEFFHSSNLLIKAALYHKPIIVSKGFCMHERVIKYKLGMSIKSGDINECWQTLEKITDRSAINTLKNNAEFKKYVEENSVKSLKDKLSSCLSLVLN